MIKESGRTSVVDFQEAAERLRPEKQSLTPSSSTNKRRKRNKRSVENDRIDEILRLKQALANLAENKSDPLDLLRHLDPLFGDELVIRENLRHAVWWINRFAEEWEREQGTHGGAGKIQQSSE